MLHDVTVVFNKHWVLRNCCTPKDPNMGRSRHTSHTNNRPLYMSFVSKLLEFFERHFKTRAAARLHWNYWSSLIFWIQPELKYMKYLRKVHEVQVTIFGGSLLVVISGLPSPPLRGASSCHPGVQRTNRASRGASSNSSACAGDLAKNMWSCWFIINVPDRLDCLVQVVYKNFNNMR